MATIQASPPTKAKKAATNEVLQQMPEQTSCLVLRETVETAGIYGIGMMIQKIPPHAILEVNHLLGPDDQNFNPMVSPGDTLQAVDGISVASSYLESVEHLVFGDLGTTCNLTLQSESSAQIYDIRVKRHVPIRVWENTRRAYEIMQQYASSDLMARKEIVEVLEGLRLHIGDGSFNTHDLLKDHRHNRSTLGIVLRVPGQGSPGKSLDASVLADNLRAIQGITKGGPAHISGAMRIGDEVIAVDGRFVDDTDVVEALRGEDAIGSTVSLTIRRGDDTFDVELVRASAAAVRFCEQLFAFIEALDMQIRSGAPQQTLLSCVQVLAEHGIDMERDRLNREAATAARLRDLQESIFNDVTTAESMLYPPNQNGEAPAKELWHDARGSFRDSFKETAGAAEPAGAAAAQQLPAPGGASAPGAVDDRVPAAPQGAISRDVAGDITTAFSAPAVEAPSSVAPAVGAGGDPDSAMYAPAGTPSGGQVEDSSGGTKAVQARLGAATEKIGSLEEDNRKLKKELDMWKAKAEGLVTHDMELEADLEVDEEAIKKLKGLLAEAKRTIAGLQSDHDNEVLERERLQSECQRYKDKAHEIHEQNDHLLDEVDAVKLRLSGLQRELQVAQDDLEQTREDLKAVRKEEEQHDKHAAEVEQRLQEEMHVLDNHHRALEDKLQHEVEDVDEHHRRVEENLQKEAQKLEQHHLEIEKHLQEEVEHVDAHHKQIEADLKKEMALLEQNLRDEIARIQEEHERERVGWKKHIAAVEGEAQEERDQAELLREKIKKLQNTVASLRGELDSLQVQMSQEMVPRTQWMASVTETKKAKLECDTRGEEIKRLNDEIDQLHKKIHTIQHDFQHERKDHEKDKHDLQEIRALLAVAGVKDPVQELDTINDELAGPPYISLMDVLPLIHALRAEPKRSVADARRMVDIMNEPAPWSVEELQKVKRLVGSSAAYEEQLENLTGEIKKLREDKTALEGSVKLLQQKVAQLEASLADSQEDTKRMQELSKALESSKKALEGQVETLKAQIDTLKAQAITLEARIGDLDEGRRQMLLRIDSLTMSENGLKAEIEMLKRKNEKLATPMLCCPGQSFPDELQLAITSPVPDTTIFYTLDGSEPSATNHLGNGTSPILVMLRDSAEVAAVAVSADGAVSRVTKDYFEYKPVAPQPQLMAAVSVQRTEKDPQRQLAGVGLLVQKVPGDLNVYVKRVVQGTPADQSGLVAVGDQIIAVDGTSVYGMDLDRIFLLVLGEEGTEVKFELLKNDQPVEVTLVRAHNMDSQVQSRISWMPERSAGAPAGPTSNGRGSTNGVRMGPSGTGVSGKQAEVRRNSYKEGDAAMPSAGSRSFASFN